MFQPSGIITLTTDFGLSDAYVSILRGAIWSRFPAAVVADVTHAVPPQDIEHGSFVLRSVWSEYPAGTVHVAVVDPGVGTARRSIVAVVNGRVYVGPDNGLLTGVWRAFPGGRAFGLAAPQLWAGRQSATFHGRDLYAPAGATFASGAMLPEAAGPVVEPVLLGAEGPPAPRPPFGERWVRIIHVDHYGNAITDWAPGSGSSWRVRLPSGAWVRSVRTYGDSAAGELISLTNSFGLMEVAINGGSAASAAALCRGDWLEVSSEETRPSPPAP